MFDDPLTRGLFFFLLLKGDFFFFVLTGVFVVGDASEDATVATVTGVTAVRNFFLGESKVSLGDPLPWSNADTSCLLLPLKSYGPLRSMVRSEVELML